MPILVTVDRSRRLDDEHFLAGFLNAPDELAVQELRRIHQRGEGREGGDQSQVRDTVAVGEAS